MSVSYSFVFWVCAIKSKNYAIRGFNGVFLFEDGCHGAEEDAAEGLATTGKGAEATERDGFEGDVFRGRLRLFDIV